MPVLKANKTLRSAFDRETKNTQIRELRKEIQPSNKDVAVLSYVSRQYFKSGRSVAGKILTIRIASLSVPLHSLHQARVVFSSIGLCV